MIYRRVVDCSRIRNETTFDLGLLHEVGGDTSDILGFQTRRFGPLLFLIIR